MVACTYGTLLAVLKYYETLILYFEKGELKTGQGETGKYTY
jgi:hypothetical protein